MDTNTPDPSAAASATRRPSTRDGLPRADELADEHDADGWDLTRHGTFAEHAQPDDAVTTVPADDYLAGGAR